MLRLLVVTLHQRRTSRVKGEDLQILKDVAKTWGSMTHIVLFVSWVIIVSCCPACDSAMQIVYG